MLRQLCPTWPAGTPPVQRHSWMESVQWVRGNALEPRTYEALLPGALAAISCVGAFGSQEHMLQTNGVANVAAIEAAAQAGIPRFVFISAAIPNIPGLEYLLGGYVNGKRMAEEALQSHYPQGGVALRPGAIYGNRVISSSLTLPLQYVFQPLEALLAHLPSRQLSQLPLLGAALTPPVPVQAVARAAVKAATDSNVAPGILDVWDIQQYKLGAHHACVVRTYAGEDGVDDSDQAHKGEEGAVVASEVVEARLYDQLVLWVEACSKRALLASLLLGLMVRGWFTRATVLADRREAFEEIPAEDAVIPNLAHAGSSSFFLTSSSFLDKSTAKQSSSRRLQAVLFVSFKPQGHVPEQ
ncbi:hypothetical protein QJQ45_011388 [Haematococcus lacustris]|nr:hypothetical protein QJQ45_011388 [Haematococcus lacustris]